MTESIVGLQEESFRISPSQKRLGTISSGAREIFYVCGTFKILREIEVSRLEKAIEKVVEAHEILRTILRPQRTFRFPLQVISNAADFRFEERDISDLNETETSGFIRDFFGKAASGAGNSAEKKSLLDAALLKTSKTENVLLLFLPAYFCDRTGFANLVNEISESYLSLEQNREYQPSGPQFVDVSEWQNENLESDEARPAREFWNDARRLFSAQQSLPVENKTPFVASVQNFQVAAAVEEFISGELFERISACGDVRALLLGCWTTLLFKYLDASEIVAGVGFDGRDYEDLKPALGNLTKHLPVAATVGPEIRFADLTRELEKKLAEAREWQDGFFWELLSKDETAETAPVFWNYCFDFYDARETGGSIFETLDIYDRLERFRLCLECSVEKDALKLSLKYDDALYTASTAERLFGQFLRLVSIIAESPQIRLGEINFTTESEKRFLLGEVNDTFFDYAEKRHFYRLFEEQAERAPQSVAAVCENREITYRELNSKSNEIAHELIALGVKPDDVIGIHLYPTIDFIISMLGVIKSGAAYLPLDPANPLERLAYMVGDAKPKAIVTQEKLAGNDLEFECPKIIIDSFAFGAEESSNPDIEIDGENLAYLIYTSGSTGKPKGVAVVHRGLTNYLQWCLREYGLETGEGVPVHSSIGFDLSVTGIMSPLIAGKKTFLLGEGSSVTALIDLLKTENDFSFIKITPSHLELLRLLLPEKTLSSIKLLIIGGEALYGEGFADWRGVSKTRVVNEYGPTETVVGCITFEKTADAIEPGNVPIGKPIPNTRVYILDERMNAVPVGAAGELYLGGGGLARGYWGKARLTAERFVPDPFGAAGERLYKTGDVGRFLSNGEIEYLGRADRQIKIRGYRVELGEIEAQTRLCPAVSDAAVEIRTDERGEKHLVCYFVSSAERSADAFSIQSFLKDKLPDYMIPSRYLALDKIPLTGNGKLDRRRLPELAAKPSDRETVFAAEAGNPVEQLLAGIWQEILDVQRVNRTDNFFDLGGHSLLATQLISRTRETFAVELELGTVFDNPQLDLLARRIAEATSGENSAAMPPLVPVSKDVPLPLSFAQQRMWLLDQIEGGSGNYNISSPLKIKGKIDLSALERSVETIVARHEILRTRFDVDADGKLFQKVEPPSPVEIETVDLRDLTFEEGEAETARLVDEQAHTRFDLSKGRAFCLKLVELAEDESVLTVTMHHIISDGWSNEIFVRELASAYRAFLNDAVPELPELNIQYADYAVWQRKYLSDERLDEQLVFWKRNLGENGGAVLELPLDRARPRLRTFTGATRWMEISPELTGKIRQVSRSENATLFMTLLAAYKVLLARISGQTNISVGTPSANRHLTQLEDLIGFFVNTLVIRTGIDLEEKFSEYLKRVREATLKAYANQDIPFEKLVEELRPERDLSRTPLFQVMFVMQNAARESLELAGIELSGFRLEQKTSKFDLTLMANESQDRLAFGLEYNTDLFTAETINGFLEIFHEILQEIAAEPGVKLSRIAFQKIAEKPEITHREASEEKKISPPPAATPQWQTVSSPFEATETEIENRIAEIWSDVLGIGSIGRKDDFFRLGGHSLLVLRVVTRIKSDFKIEISIRDLFENPILEHFAKFVDASAKAANAPEDTIQAPENLEYYPLSFSQKRLWFIQQLEPQSSVYNVPLTLKINGRLRVELIERAFAIIAGRHEILRTKFTVIDGTPFQKILPPEKVEIETFDLTNGASADEIRGIISRLTNEPFDLSAGKLFRIGLVKLSEDESILHLIVHHIASDGETFNILVREFSAVYAALLENKIPELPSLPIKYADYAFWQNKNFKDEKFTEKIAYWKETLGESPVFLNLPTDKPRPHLPTGAGGKFQYVFPAGFKARAAEFTRRNDATMFMTFLSAFAVLMAKYSGQTEIPIGTPVANRDRAELENLVGIFVNTLIVKADLSGDPSFTDTVKRIRNAALSAFANQDVPFEMLVEELKTERSLNINPLFQVMFAYIYKPEENLKLSGLDLAPLDSEENNAMFDLTFTVFETETDLGVEIEYSTDLFVPETIAQMCDRFRLLSEKVIESPDEKLRDIPLMTDEEKKENLKRLAPPLAEKADMFFHRMFEEQVRKTPDAVALMQDDDILTYAELNARANRLAFHLKTKGVESEKIVCVYQNRSIAMTVSVLAILKAGGAYIPFEPDTPASRVNAVLSEIPSPFVISETPYFDALDAAPENKINPSAEAAIIARNPPENLSSEIYDDNAAYLIYTSGSTGKPKGVVISHRALGNHLLWMMEFQPHRNDQRFMMSSSLSFDASVWELHKPLISGASAVVINTKQQLDLNYLIGQIEKHRVTTMQTTPSFLGYLLKNLEDGQCESLEEVFVGGESLTADIVEKFRKTFPECRLYNAYGPTETTIDATITGEAEDDLSGEKISIGRSVSNKYVYVLDEDLNLLPEGVTGEIFIGGAGLARGYFARPAETAEKFIPDPFAVEPGARIYRTGDFGKYLSNGHIEFLGRKDQQVKINGQRLELAEIEAICANLPQIGEAVVEVVGQKDGRKLAAFFTARGEDKPSDAEIRSYLRENLPEFMIPKTFQWIGAMPILPSGKIDRKDLRARFRENEPVLTLYIAPQTEAQSRVAEIWQTVLERENIGLHDNFFDLGGHSLLLIRVLERIEKSFEKNVTILDLFMHTTVESLADFLTSETTEENLAGVVERAGDRQKRAARSRDIRQKRRSIRNDTEN